MRARLAKSKGKRHALRSAIYGLTLSLLPVDWTVWQQFDDLLDPLDHPPTPLEPQVTFWPVKWTQTKNQSTQNRILYNSYFVRFSQIQATS